MLLRDSSNTTRQSATDNRVKAIVAHFYNNSITMTPDTLGVDWATLEVIPTASTTIPTAVLSLNTSTGVISVTQVGTAAGFIIRNSSGIVVVKCYFVEGKGTNWINNITYNVVSGNNGNGLQPIYFEIKNITVANFWVSSFRKTNPYLIGYSVNVPHREYFVNGNCNALPDLFGRNDYAGHSVSNGTFNIDTFNAVFFGNYDGADVNDSLMWQGYPVKKNRRHILSFKVTEITYSPLPLFFRFTDNSQAGQSFTYPTEFRLDNYNKRLNVVRFYMGKGKIDNLSYKEMSNEGIMVPPHETLQGKDATMNNLTFIRAAEQLVLKTKINGLFNVSVTNSRDVLEYEEGGVKVYSNNYSKAFTGQTNTVNVKATGDWLGVTAFNCTSMMLLGDMSKGFGSMTNLTTLYLAANQLTSIPTEIGNLTKLVTFYINNNLLTDLPSEIGNCTSLVTFICNANDIVTIPTTIGNLNKLVTLFLYDNLIVTIPPEISGLVKLDLLQLSYNKIITVPIEVGALPLLTNLLLNDNLITTVNNNIFTNLNIKTLWLNKNRMTQATLESCLDAIPLVIAPSKRTIKLEANTGSAATASSRANLINELKTIYNYDITI